MDFPAPFIQPPVGDHTHTAILLHGRGSNGPEFAEELFSSKNSSGLNIPESLPGWRWVFPTSKPRFSVVFKEYMSAWFDVTSLTDTHDRQDLQVEGLRESVLYVFSVLESEIKLVGGDPKKIVLGGMSQGMATALWVLLCSYGAIGTESYLGGFMGFCGWLPFANDIETLTQRASEANVETDQLDPALRVSRFLWKTIGRERIGSLESDKLAFHRTPVFLGHGKDDVFVDVSLGRHAAQLLRRIGLAVELKEYEGAENEGHWIKEPEGFDNLNRFLRSGIASVETDLSG